VADVLICFARATSFVEIRDASLVARGDILRLSYVAESGGSVCAKQTTGKRLEPLLHGMAQVELVGGGHSRGDCGDSDGDLLTTSLFRDLAAACCHAADFSVLTASAIHFILKHTSHPHIHTPTHSLTHSLTHHSPTPLFSTCLSMSLSCLAWSGTLSPSVLLQKMTKPRTTSRLS
jgi:hypothetical protein